MLCYYYYYYYYACSIKLLSTYCLYISHKVIGYKKVVLPKPQEPIEHNQSPLGLKPNRPRYRTMDASVQCTNAIVFLLFSLSSFVWFHHMEIFGTHNIHTHAQQLFHYEIWLVTIFKQWTRNIAHFSMCTRTQQLQWQHHTGLDCYDQSTWHQPSSAVTEHNSANSANADD